MNVLDFIGKSKSFKRRVAILVMLIAFAFFAIATGSTKVNAAASPAKPEKVNNQRAVALQYAKLEKVVANLQQSNSGEGNSGSINTTDENCVTQNENHYNTYDTVWVALKNFPPNTTIKITIYGLPYSGTGGASGDPGAIVHEVEIQVDSEGNACATTGYVIPPDDWGEYSVGAPGVKNDNYRVDQVTATPVDPSETPEDNTPTPTVEFTPTPTVEFTPTDTPEPTSTEVTVTPSEVPTETATTEPSPTPQNTETATTEPSPTPVDTATSEPTPTTESTPTPEDTPTPENTATLVPSNTPENTPTTAPTVTTAPTATTENTPTPVDTATSEPTPTTDPGTPTLPPTAENTPTLVPTPSEPTPTTDPGTGTPEPTVVPTDGPTPQPTATVLYDVRPTAPCPDCEKEGSRAEVAPSDEDLLVVQGAYGPCTREFKGAYWYTMCNQWQILKSITPFAIQNHLGEIKMASPQQDPLGNTWYRLADTADWFGDNYIILAVVTKLDANGKPVDSVEFSWREKTGKEVYKFYGTCNRTIGASDFTLKNGQWCISQDTSNPGVSSQELDNFLVAHLGFTLEEANKLSAEFVANGRNLCVTPKSIDFSALSYKKQFAGQNVGMENPLPFRKPQSRK